MCTQLCLLCLNCVVGTGILTATLMVHVTAPPCPGHGAAQDVLPPVPL